VDDELGVMADAPRVEVEAVVVDESLEVSLEVSVDV